MARERSRLLEAGRYLNEGRAPEALRILDQLAVSPEHEPVRLRYMAIGHNIAGETDRSVELIERAIQLAGQRGDREERVWAMSLLAALRAKQDRHVEALDLVRTCLDECERGIVLDVSFRIGCLGQLADELTALGQHSEALGACERAVELATRLGDARSRAALYAELATTSEEQGDEGNVEYYRQKSVFVLEEMRLMRSLAQLMEKTATLYAAAGDAARSEECWTRAKHFADPDR